MFANVTKDGLGITVHNSLASTWITVQVTRFLLYIMNVWSFNLVRKYRSNLSAKKGCLFTYFIFFKMKRANFNSFVNFLLSRIQF